MIKVHNKLLLALFSLCIGFASCDQNEEIEPLNPDGTYRAIVVNEGQFGYGTASLTGILRDGSAEQDVFRRVNNRPMGDVAQSMTRIGDCYYVPLNNSRKLEVFDVTTFKSVETISIDNDVIPMYVQHLGGDSIAVTDQKWLGISNLMIIDINHNDPDRKKVRRYISMEGATFQLQLTAGKLFVGGDKLAVFDLGAIDVSGKRYVATEAGDVIPVVDFSKIVTDKKGMIWVLSKMDKLFRIDPNTERVIASIDLSGLKINHRTSSLDISPDGGTVYFNARTSIYAVDVENIQTPTAPLISPTVDSNRVIYHMCVSKENTIFMCDVRYGSLSRAIIHEFDLQTGNKLNEAKAGLFPHFIYFM